LSGRSTNIPGSLSLTRRVFLHAAHRFQVRRIQILADNSRARVFDEFGAFAISRQQE
jgi:hypothetical protein